ncbi:hypothetical protein AMATHDRAFT_74329 [Amanita thiersii Skay4041]|uniref:Copper homeostasis protein cutC homolog n=1 Tax=Amanita thiersii Skay4041 TaxID=703135 RepID=A0A2A9NP07_9AGAR|nr:hypothetical protein AMATHDRAFT_74329 [Amanita thiersii Skay4041]
MTEAPLPIIIEVCVDSVESAMNAIRGGADRLELCANLGAGGGTTPSLGFVKSIQDILGEIPIMIMVRPRMGDFIYTEDEIKVMLEDIRIFKKCDIRGIVIGALTSEGRVDVECMKRLVDEALPLEVCFHRAFDMTRDPEEALYDIANIGGISRILTSGHGKTAPSALETLKLLLATRQEIMENDPWGLSIMPGSGVNAQNIHTLLEVLLPLGLKEIHMSGGTWMEGSMAFRRQDMGMGCGESEWSIWRTQEEKVRQVRFAVDSYWQDLINLYPPAPSFGEESEGSNV